MTFEIKYHDDGEINRRKSVKSVFYYLLSDGRCHHRNDILAKIDCLLNLPPGEIDRRDASGDLAWGKTVGTMISQWKDRGWIVDDNPRAVYQLTNRGLTELKARFGRSRCTR